MCILQVFLRISNSQKLSQVISTFNSESGDLVHVILIHDQIQYSSKLLCDISSNSLYIYIQLSKILGVTQHLLDQPCDYQSQIVMVNQLCLYWCYGFFFRRDNMLEQEVVNLLEQTEDTVDTEVIISHQPGTGSLGFDGYWWYPSVPGAVSSFCHLTQSTVLCAILIQQVILINFKSFNITSKLHMHPTLPVYQRLMATLAGTTINQAY